MNYPCVVCVVRASCREPCYMLTDYLNEEVAPNFHYYSRLTIEFVAQQLRLGKFEIHNGYPRRIENEKPM